MCKLAFQLAAVTLVLVASARADAASQQAETTAKQGDEPEADAAPADDAANGW